jgi:hypothetical protein
VFSFWAADVPAITVANLLQKGEPAMVPLTHDEFARVQTAIEEYAEALGAIGIVARVRRDFDNYASIRHAQGTIHLNQAFDPAFTRFKSDDFWLLAQNQAGEPIATYCVRRLEVENFLDLVRSQVLWFGEPGSTDPRFVVKCKVPSFGGEVSHGGGLWVREDYRGGWRVPRMSTVMMRLGRAIGLRNKPFDHDSAMILVDPQCPPRLIGRKAMSLALEAYRFARARPMVNGWFPPEGRRATVYLCHSTRSEVIASLMSPPLGIAAGTERVEFRDLALVYQHQ